MRTVARLVSLAFCLALPLSAPPLDAQRAGSTPRRVALDPNAQVVPPGFVPDDPEVVFRELTPPKKDEFETTAQYEARLARLKPKPIYVFSYSLAPNSASYDADAQRLSIPLPLLPNAYYGTTRDQAQSALVLKEVDRGYREYPASNAFGATISASRSITDFFVLVIPKSSTLIAAADKTTQVSLAPDAARQVKPNLGLLVLVEGAAPFSTYFVTTGADVTQPTLTKPNAYSERYHNLHLLLKSVWVYNRKTGQVYAKRDGLFR